MLTLLWKLTRGNRLTPWNSPYLRWRIETYWGLHADQITFRQFWGFVWTHRLELRRYLAWARAGRRPGTKKARPLHVFGAEYWD